MKLYFIACPYFDPDPEVVEQRFEQCTYVAANLALSGFAAYSQITMTHPINETAARVKKKITWAPINEAFMEKCDELILLTLAGWENSGGVANEIAFFKSRGRKVWTYDEFAAEYDL